MKALTTILLMPLVIAYGVTRDIGTRGGWTGEADRARTSGAGMASLIGLLVIYVFLRKLLGVTGLPFPAWAIVATSVAFSVLILHYFVDRGFGDARWREFQRAPAWQRAAGYVATIALPVGTVALLILRW